MIDSEKATIGILLAVFLVISTFAAVPIANAYTGSILSPLLQNNVVVDGKWTTADEWIDASETSLFFYKGSGQAILRTKHDGNYLYILVDFVSDTTENKERGEKNDACALHFDCDHDAAMSPQKDDFRWVYSFRIPEQPAKVFDKGDGSKTWPEMFRPIPQDLVCDSSMDATNDPYSRDPHRVYEFRIPRKYFKEDAIGFYVWCNDGEYDIEKAVGIWPVTSPEVPNKWTELKFSNRLVSQIAGLKTLMFPVRDVELSYRADLKWYIAKGREISATGVLSLKPIKVQDSNYEISMNHKGRIEAPAQTSMIDTFFYAMNGSVIGELKSASPIQEIHYQNIYVMDGKKVREIRGDGVSYAYTKIKVGDDEYWSSRGFMFDNFYWWSGISQAGKFVQILNLDPIRLEDGGEYQFNDAKWKTLTATTRLEQGDWVISYTWVWEKETGILLEYTCLSNNTRRGWKAFENIKLDKVHKTETSLTAYCSPPNVAPGEIVRILGAVSVLGQTTLRILVTGPDGSRTEKIVDCNSLGEFTLPLSFDREGKYSVRAEWGGTILHRGATSEESVFTVSTLKERPVVQTTETRIGGEGEGPLGLAIVVVLIAAVAALAILVIRKRAKES